MHPSGSYGLCTRQVATALPKAGLRVLRHLARLLLPRGGRVLPVRIGILILIRRKGLRDGCIQDLCVVVGGGGREILIRRNGLRDGCIQDLCVVVGGGGVRSS